MNINVVFDYKMESDIYDSLVLERCQVFSSSLELMEVLVIFIQAARCRYSTCFILFLPID